MPTVSTGFPSSPDFDDWTGMNILGDENMYKGLGIAIINGGSLFTHNHKLTGSIGGDIESHRSRSTWISM